MRHKILLIGLLLIAFSSNAQKHPYQKKFKKVDTYVENMLKEWNIPGLALAIVYKDQLIYGKGYGFRDLENKLPVTAATLFPIASNTKLFTATLATQLAQEGKLSLDKPVRNYLPALNFYNDELNTKVTLRDMLSHRTGLPSYDGIWINSQFKRADILNKISYMKPALGFREGYIYNNNMFTTAGVAIEAVTGKSWEDNVIERIFKPLAMNHSGFFMDGVRSDNYSLSYFEPDSTDRLMAKKYSSQSAALGPAGTIKSNMEDMSHWMIAQLNGGKYEGRQVIPAEAIAETMVPNAISDKRGRYEELSNSIYALGRSLQTYKGNKIVSHTGSIDAFYSNLTFLPKESIAIFMVHNLSSAGSLRSVMSLPVIDILLGEPETPWSSRYRKEYLDGKARQKKSTDSIKRIQVKDTKTSHSLQDYAGTYHHPVYGDIKIEKKGENLFALFRSLNLKLHHFHYDQFITIEEGNDNPDLRLNFYTNNKGEIDRISTQPFGDPLTEFLRKR
ncbi:MAG TPA: serine hydrolase [Sphingobacteriaceae bacterium]|nr:serine hydrolase [Sphingobacteriaceae bacterium]